MLYTPEVYSAIQYIVATCKKEVGWLGLVKEVDNNFLVYEIFVPKQTVTHTETEIDADAMSDLAEEIFEAGGDIEHLYYWGHSHVDMDVGPSAQDEDQIAEYLEHCPRFIRGIYNKRGDAKIDYYARDEGLMFLNCEHGMELKAETKTRLDELIDTNVQEYTYTYTYTRPLYQPPANTPKKANDYQPHVDYYGEDFDRLYGGYR